MLSTKIRELKTLYATENKVYDKKNAVNVNMSVIRFFFFFFRKKNIFSRMTKKNWVGSIWWVGRSTANQQCFKVRPSFSLIYACVHCSQGYLLYESKFEHIQGFLKLFLLESIYYFTEKIKLGISCELSV